MELKRERTLEIETGSVSYELRERRETHKRAIWKHYGKNWCVTRNTKRDGDWESQIGYSFGSGTKYLSVEHAEFLLEMLPLAIALSEGEE